MMLPYLVFYPHYRVVHELQQDKDVSEKVGGDLRGFERQIGIN
jgi:hypothetical protein